MSELVISEAATRIARDLSPGHWYLPEQAAWINDARNKIQTAINSECEVLRKELAQEKIWKVEDPRMLREQIRVADVAFNDLHERHKQLLRRDNIRNATVDALRDEHDTLTARVKELEAVVIRANNALLMALNNQGGMTGQARFPKPVWQEIQATRSAIDSAMQKEQP